MQKVRFGRTVSRVSVPGRPLNRTFEPFRSPISIGLHHPLEVLRLRSCVNLIVRDTMVVEGARHEHLAVGPEEVDIPSGQFPKQFDGKRFYTPDARQAPALVHALQSLLSSRPAPAPPFI